MPRRTGRTPEDTRRALLSAAAEVVRDRGAAASLDEIARVAGVSKGGLLYHFATKGDLVRALATDLMDTFRAEVAAALDPVDDAPGRLTRAYVRACMAAARDEAAARESIGLVARLGEIAEVADLASADADRWAAELAADGLPDHVSTLVTTAADGASAAPVWGAALPDAQARLLTRQLLRLTLDRELWRALAPGDATG